MANGTTVSELREEVNLRFWQVGLLLVEIGSAILVGLAHWGFSWVVDVNAPEGVEKFVDLLDVVFFACFSVVYVQLAIDMVSVFVPLLRQRTPKKE